MNECNVQKKFLLPCGDDDRCRDRHAGTIARLAVGRCQYNTVILLYCSSSSFSLHTQGNLIYIYIIHSTLLLFLFLLLRIIFRYVFSNHPVYHINHQDLLMIQTDTYIILYYIIKPFSSSLCIEFHNCWVVTFFASCFCGFVSYSVWTCLIVSQLVSQVVSVFLKKYSINQCCCVDLFFF